MAFVTATTLAVASLATAAVGTGVAVYGQAQQAKAANRAANYNAQVGEMNARQVSDTAAYNAKVLEQQAIQKEMDGRENIRRKREENRRYLSTQRGRFATSGVTNEGSPLLVMGETASLLEMDAQEINRTTQIESARIRAGAAEEVRQGAFQSTQYRNQAGLDLLYGRQASSAARIGMASTLLSGASSSLGSYATFKKTGALK